jgi:hypothetical protein
MPPYIHVFALSIGLILSILFGIYRKSWIGGSIIYAGCIYVLLVTSFVVDVTSLFTDTQFSKFFFLALFLYAGVFLLGFVLSSPKNHALLVLRTIKSRRFFVPAGIVLGLPAIPLVADFALKMAPEIDKYEKVDSFWFEQLKATNKGFQVAEITDSSLTHYEKIIRIYKMPSFEKGKLIELKYEQDIRTVTAITHRENSMREDRQVQYHDKSGQLADGRVLDSTGYKPEASLLRYTSREQEITRELSDSLESFPVSKMSSINRTILFELGYIAHFDGTIFVVDIRNGCDRNTFTFLEQKYDDSRYNWILEHFDSIFKNIEDTPENRKVKARSSVGQ